MTLRRILTITIILLVLVGLLFGASWYFSRRTAEKNGTTPLTFRQFLGIGTPAAPGQNVQNEFVSQFTDDTSADRNNNGVADGEEDLNLNGTIDKNDIVISADGQKTNIFNSTVKGMIDVRAIVFSRFGDANANRINDWNEDIDGNGDIDGGEDKDGNGIIDGYGNGSPTTNNGNWNTDADGNGIPDGREDKDNNGIPDWYGPGGGFSDGGNNNNPGGNGNSGGPTDGGPGGNSGGGPGDGGGFTDGPLMPTSGGPVNGGNPTDGPGSTPNGTTGGPGADTPVVIIDPTTPGTTITEDVCSDADTNIEFTAQEIARLNTLRLRFSNIAANLYSAGDVEQQLALYDSFVAKSAQLGELIAFCENTVSSLPSALQVRVPTPFYHDSARDNNTFTGGNEPTLPNRRPYLENPSVVTTLVERLLRINIW